MKLAYLQTLITEQADRIWTLAWNPNGTLLATGGADKIIRIWAKDANSRWICSSILADTHTKTVRRLSWSPCGQYLASASFDATVCIWQRDSDDSSWSVNVNLEGHENEVKSVSWSNDGKFLATCGRDRTVWIWEHSQDTNDEDQNKCWDCSDVKNDHTKDVKQILWHPKFNILASCSYDDTVKLFHLEENDWKCFETLIGHNSTVWSADFSSSGEYLVTCSHDNTLKIWKNHSHDKLPLVEPRSWKCINTIQGNHTRPIYDVSWCKHNDIIISGSGDNSLVLYKKSIDSGDEGNFVCHERHMDAHSCDINAVVWNPKEVGLLATAGDDGFIKLWKYSTDEKGTDSSTKSQAEYKTNVTDHSNLLNLVKNLQILQKDINQQDLEISKLEKVFDLMIDQSNMRPLTISDIIDDRFVITIQDEKNCSQHKFSVHFDRKSFDLDLPKRSCKLFRNSDVLFIIEKTGDLYRMNQKGRCEFLLGHLFSLSDLVISKCKSYIISADRDEKIRISKYPETFKIERYAFGHEHFIKRLFIVDDDHFLSIDHNNTACLWDISKLDTMPSKAMLRPAKIVPLPETNIKRARTN